MDGFYAARASTNDGASLDGFVTALHKFDVHPNQITQWRSQLLDGAAGVFGSDGKSEATTPVIDVKTLHAKIGELALENDFLSGALGRRPAF
ncbi:hypothetical protein C8D03_1334 [Bosea sp. 124]|nr:hypothetical protein C8D03_1334 [Bosea sp. 124]